MPKLLIFAACEKVIFDRTSEVPSLIGIFYRMNVQAPEVPFPVNTVAPLRWTIFTLWLHTPDDAGKTFHQKLQIIKPNGEGFGDGASTEYKIANSYDLQSKTQIDVQGMPIDEEGPVTVRVWLEENPDMVGEYPFYVKHIPHQPKA